MSGDVKNNNLKEETKDRFQRKYYYVGIPNEQGQHNGTFGTFGRLEGGSLSRRRVVESRSRCYCVFGQVTATFFFRLCIMNHTGY